MSIKGFIGIEGPVCAVEIINARGSLSTNIYECWEALELTQGLESVNGLPRQRNTLTKLGTKRVSNSLVVLGRLSPRSVTKIEAGFAISGCTSSQSADQFQH